MKSEEECEVNLCFWKMKILLLFFVKKELSTFSTEGVLVKSLRLIFRSS